MGKAITIKHHHSEEALEHEIKHAKDGRYRLRVQVILWAMREKSSDCIKQELLVSKPAIFRWARWYNKKGLEGLLNVSKGGRKEGNPKWDNEIFQALFAKLDLMEEFWSVPKMASWIAQTYSQEIPEQTIHYRLKKGGYSFKSSRPNPYKGDPALQAAFKKKEL